VKVSRVPARNLPSPRAADGVPGPPEPPEAVAPAGVDPWADDLRLLSSMDDDDPARGELRDRVVESHLGLVEHLARRYTDRGEPYDDLVQVGTIGLLKAVDRFDPAMGRSFAAYAVPTILGEIRRHFRDRGWAVRVPRRLQELTRTIAAARAALTQELSRAPTVDELAIRAGVDAEAVLEGLESAGAYATVPLDTDHDAGGAHLAFDDTALEGVENREALRPLLARLPARERRILALRYVRGLSQAEIATEVGISQMHVSRLLARTLGTLRTGFTEGE